MRAKPKLLFVISESLGWRTYRRHIAAVVNSRDDIEAVFYEGRLSMLERALARNLRGEKLGRLVDPIFIWQKHLDKWWARQRKGLGVDAIHVATQINALAFADSQPMLPFSVAHDNTRRTSRVDFEAATFSQRSLEAEQRVFERASLLFPMSSWAKASLINDYKIPDRNVIVVPPSVEISDAVDASTVPQGLVDIIFIGNDFVRKGGRVLLDLHQEKFRERAHLHIVSKQFRAQTNLENVISYGFVPNEVITRELLPQMDIFCMPTRSDMSPFVCSEASAASVPIVVTDVGGLGDVCHDNKTGFLIKKGDIDALEQRLTLLIDRPELRKRLGKGAHMLAKTRLNANTNYNKVIDRIVATC